MTDIRCRTVDGTAGAIYTGVVECSLTRGAVCVSRPGEVECPDYEISVLCGCGTCQTSLN